MAILFVGNAPDDFNAAWVENTATSGTARDTAYSPSCSQISGRSDAGAQGVINLPVAPTGDVWFHGRFFTAPNINTTSVDGHLISFYAPGDVLLARFDAQDGNWRAQVFGDTTVVGTNFTPSSSALITFDFKLSVGANITLEVYQNGSLLSSATAANTAAKPAVRLIVIDFFDVVLSDGNSWFLSEVIVTDGGESTIGWRLATFTPTSAGFHTAWDGDFNHVTNGFDGRFLLSDAANEKESWINSNYGGPGSPASIRAVVARFNSDRGATGPQNIAPFLRIGGTDYEAAAVAADYQTVQLGVWDQNPATAAAWAVGALSGLEVGVKSVA